MPYNVEEKYMYVSEVFYSIFKPVIRGSRKYNDTFRAYYKNPRYSIVTVDWDYRRRVGTIIIDLPGRRPRKPVVYHVYVSAQFSRRISPAQLMPKIRKLLRERRKYNNEYVDRATYLYAPKGLTIGAKQLIRQYGIIPAKSRNDIVRSIAKYWRNRYVQLLAALRGKRLYGELLLLALILREIARQYWGNNLGISDPLEKYTEYYPPTYLAETGITIENIHVV